MNALQFYDLLIMTLTRDGSGSRYSPSQKGWWCTLSGALDFQLQKLGIPGCHVHGDKKHCNFNKSTAEKRRWFLAGESFLPAAYLMRALLEVLYDTQPKFVLFSVEQVSGPFRKLKDLEALDFVPCAKFFLVVPMARYLSQTIDSPPASYPKGYDLLFDGTVRKFIKNRINSKNDRSLAMCWGLLQGVKRGCFAVGQEFVVATMRGHAAKMLKEPTEMSSWADIEDWNSQFDQLFKGFKGGKPSLFEASVSASFQSKRSAGGSREFIRSVLKSHGDDDEGLLSMVETRPGQVKTVRGLPCPSVRRILDLILHPEKDLELSLPERGSFVGPLRWGESETVDGDGESWNPLREDPLVPNCREEEIDQRCGSDVMVSAVLEPLKCRLITKGNSLRYWVARFFQKSLWKFLYALPQFSLTGRVLSAMDLSLMMSREAKVGLAGMTGFVSGDYSAATDGLEIEFTKLAYESALRRCNYNADMFEVLRSVLYEQKMHYPPKAGILPFVQKNGQLMGSITSFPILCAINLICYKRALERYLHEVNGGDIRTLKIKDLPVLINGDDILFRANDRLYAIWNEEIKLVGFKLSIGKNYFHPTILTVNSECYKVTIHDGVPKFHEVLYLNTGLLTGQSKITGRAAAKKLPIWDSFNRVVRGAVNPLRAAVRFLHYHSDTIKDITLDGRFNLFLPQMRGGLGFDRVPGLDVYLTPFQRAWARFMKVRWSEDLKAGVPPRSTLGLVRVVRQRPAIEKYHFPNLLWYPKIGPMEADVMLYQPRTVQLPPLAWALEEETPEEFGMKFKRPSRSVWNSFNSQHWEPMYSEKIFDFPYTLVERSRTLSLE